MPGVAVVTDSASDLSQALAERHGITIVPLVVRFGDEELLDRAQLSPAEFWERCRSAPELPETAACPPGAFRRAFEEAVERGHDGVLCVTISGSLSATYQSAQAAANDFAAAPVEVVDSRSVTMGQGLLAIAAADDAADGCTLAELVARSGDRIARTRVYGVVDTLDHLQRGGRIGGAKALLGSLLSIKPVLQVNDGVVAEESKQRTRTRSLEYLAGKVRADAPFERLAVANGAAADADVDLLLGKLSDLAVAHETVVTELGPAVGTHAGPGTIGVCYQVAAAS